MDDGSRLLGRMSWALTEDRQKDLLEINCSGLRSLMIVYYFFFLKADEALGGFSLSPLLYMSLVMVL